MAPAEQETTYAKTTTLPRMEPPPGPRPAWPFVVVAVVAAVVIGLVGLLVLGDDSGPVRSEAVRSVPTTSTTVTPTTQVTPQTTTPSAGGGAPVTTAPPAPAPTRPPSVAWEGLRLSLDGLGPVDIGMTPAEASAAAGVQIRVDPSMDLGRGCAYARADRGPADRLFMVVDGRIVRIDVGARGEGRQTLTVSGIGVGSTEDEVKRTYPGRISVAGHPYRPEGHYLLYTPADAGLRHLRMLFETDGRVVTSFRAGLADPVGWIEGCA